MQRMVNVLSTTSYTSWTCQNPQCAQEFTILMVMRPTQAYFDEFPETQQSDIAVYDNPDHPPYCPHCGEKLPTMPSAPEDTNG